MPGLRLEIKDGGKTVKIGKATVVVCCEDCAEKAKAEPVKYGLEK